MAITPILGCSGSGKSELVRRLVHRATEEKPPRFVRVFVDDPNSQWTAQKLRRANFVGVDPSALSSVKQYYVGQHKAMVRFPLLIDEDLVELAKLAQNCHPKRDQEDRTPDIALVLDELTRACNQSGGWAGGARGPFRQLLFSHRHYGIHIYACTQSPRVIDRHVLANAEEIYLCRMQARKDWQWIEENCGPEFLKATLDLPSEWPLSTVRWRPMKKPERIEISKI